MSPIALFKFVMTLLKISSNFWAFPHSALQIPLLQQTITSVI